MQIRTVGQSFLAIGVAVALAAPVSVYGQSSRHSASYHNFAPDEFFTQAERDLIERVRLRISENSAVETYADTIGMKAEMGKVTLQGEVKNEKDKVELATTVRETLGVMLVDNQLQITGSTSL
ncbi:MAG: BON domain-containing protein [Candidatus Binatia bacterium]